MSNILIIGAHGEIARVATQLLLEQTDAMLTLYLRKARRFGALASNPRIRLVEADATDGRGGARSPHVRARHRLCQPGRRNGASGTSDRRRDENGGGTPAHLHQLDGHLQ